MITDKQREFFEFLLNGVSKSDFTSNLENLVNEAKKNTDLSLFFNNGKSFNFFHC